MKRLLVLLFLFAFLIPSFAQAALTTIGTATFQGSDYKLIWDDDNNGSSLIWLDYTRQTGTWTTQRDWAAGLNSVLTNIQTPGYIIDWGEISWRLPSAGENPSTGYDQTTSEMGHLWYVELGFNTGDEPTLEELNSFVFNELRLTYYYTGTTSSPGWAYYFYMGDGAQGVYNKTSWRNTIAVCSAQVTPVPVPTAIWLLGSGIVGLIGLRRN